MQGLPRIKVDTTKDFFDSISAETHDPSVWVGELYFEYHRGTYTTHAGNKVGDLHAAPKRGKRGGEEGGKGGCGG